MGVEKLMKEQYHTEIEGLTNVKLLKWTLYEQSNEFKRSFTQNPSFICISKPY